MAKILTDKELAQIICDAVNDDEIDDATTYKNFLLDIADVVTGYFGGTPGSVGIEDGVWYCAVRLSEEVPSNGGVYSKYDTDVIWRDGEEVERELSEGVG